MKKNKVTRWVDNTHYYFGNVLVTIHTKMKTEYSLSGHVTYWQTISTIGNKVD